MLKETIKRARFIDYNGDEQQTIIRFREGIFIDVDTYNQHNNPTGYMSIYMHANNRFFLDVIYCYNEFRGLGIATIISELVDYLLKDYSGYVIRGVYKPCQLSTDRENKIECSSQELDMRARQFYDKTGYQIVKYEDYFRNKEKYPYLTTNDFYLGEDGYETIVAKPIILKEYSFYEEDGIIYHQNYNKTNKIKKRNR